ncbi:MAG: HIT family protein [Candidatus Vogelbacteria bacterium]|nr:HIT family protein [Candidatus Vogelbacteria bacterium]
MADCIFCKIVNKEIPAEVVYETEDWLAFLDLKPVNLGHTLLIPKTHHEMLVDAPDKLLSQAIVLVKKLMIAIKKAAGADFTVLSVVGIDVPHLHFHILPRYHNDGLANFWPTKTATAEEQKQIAAKIKTELQ